MHNPIVSLGEASHWIGDELARLGRPVTGTIEQPHVRPWSTVLRVPTSDGPIFFKAVTASLAYEVEVTQSLVDWLPDVGPKLLAINAERSWMLMADGGHRLRDTLEQDRDLRHWEAALARYAQVQIAVAPRLPSLLARGLPDRRPTQLPHQVAQLLTDESMLQLGQPDGLTRDDHQCLLDAMPRVSTLCEQLAASRLPNAIDHGDLHDGNIFFDGARYVFFDWGDSSAGHPFVSLRAAFVSVENRFELAEDAAEFEPLLNAYLDPWAQFAPRAELHQVYGVAKRLAPLCAALRWHRALGALDPAARAAYAYAIPSLLREFLDMVRT